MEWCWSRPIHINSLPHTVTTNKPASTETMEVVQGLLLFSHQLVSDSAIPQTAACQASPVLYYLSRVCSNSCPLSQWRYLTSSSSPAHFSSCPQSFSASGSFPMNSLFSSGSQCIGALASVLPMNIQGWFPLGLTALISLLSKGLSRVFVSTTRLAS